MEKQKIFVIEKEFRTHPIYKNYAASVDGEIYSLLSNKILKARVAKNKYLRIGLYDKKKNKPRVYYIHRFVFECYHGIIPKFVQVDHWNDVRDDNRLCNLKLLTPKENVQKSSHKKNKKIIAVNIQTKEEVNYISLTIAAKELEINPSQICMICKNKRKYAKSKTNNQKYSFRYSD